jgi:hypothetical protein
MFLLLPLSVIVATGCGKGGSGASSGNEGASLKSINITPASVSIAKGTTCLLTAKGKYSDSAEYEISDTINWVSSNPDIAIVANGLVTGVNEGSAVITARDSATGISTSIELTVAKVLAITVTTDDPVIKKGVPQQFKATGTLSDRQIQDMTAFVNWSSSDPNIAAISGSTKGEVTGVAAGKAVITAIWNSNSGSADLTIFDAPILTGPPTFSANAIKAGDTVDITIPVSRDAYNIDVSLYDLYWNYLGQASLTNSAGAESVTVTVTTVARAVNGSYYPRIYLSNNLSGSSFYELDNSYSISHYTAKYFGDYHVTENSGISIPFLTVTDLPDLKVSITNVATNGPNITVYYKVSNVGVGAVGAFWADIWNNRTNPPSPGDHGDNYKYYSGLTAGGTIEDSAVIDGALTSGTAYALIDTDGLVAELDETNNQDRFIWPNGVSIPYAPEPGPFANSITLGDDEMSGILPIGFDFEYFGNTYNGFRISSNGFITFDLTESSSFLLAESLPSNDMPNNFIAFAATDLYPPGGGTITYEILGTAPNRKLIVNVENMDFCCTVGEPKVTTQAILYEGSNIIEIHTLSLPSGHIYTQGIENADGTDAYFVPGRVASDFGLVNDAVRFYTK